MVSSTLRTTAGHDVAFGDAARPAIGLEGIDGLAFGDDVAARPAEAATLVDAAQAAIDGLVGGLLQPDVERRRDGEPALVQRLGAVLRLEVLADLFEEIRRDAAVSPVGSPATTIGFSFAASAASRVMKPSSAMRSSA